MLREKYGKNITDCDVMSYCMYPSVFEAYMVSRIPVKVVMWEDNPTLKRWNYFTFGIARALLRTTVT
jgi:pyruvate carboxylase